MNPDSPQNPREALEARITALLLGELPAEEAAALRETIAHNPELTRLHDRLKLALELVREARPTPELAAEAKPEPFRLAPERRTKLLKLFKQPTAKIIKPPFPWRAHRRELLQLAAMVVALLTVTGLVLFNMIRRDSEVYKRVLEGEDMPPVSSRVVFGLLRLIGVESESHPLLVMDKLGDASTVTVPANTTSTQLPADRNRNASANGTVGDPQWIGVLGLTTNSVLAITPPSPARSGSFTVTVVPKPSISSEGTVNGIARELDAKAAASPAPKLPVVGLQLQDAERGEAAKRSLATIALPQSADAYGTITDSRNQPASGLALAASAGQPGGLSGGGGIGSGGSGPLGKSAQAGGRASSGERPLIANNAWGYDPSQPIPGRPDAGVAAGTRVEAFGAQPTSRDAGGLGYLNAPQSRPAESKERSAEARPNPKSSSGKAEMLAVREPDERERNQKKSVPVLGDLPMLGRLFQRDGKGKETAVAGKPAAAASASRAQQADADVLQVVTVPTEPPPVMGREIAQIEDSGRSRMNRRGAVPAGPGAPSPQTTLPAPSPALKPTEHGAFVAAIPAPTDAPKSGAARKPDADGDGGAAVKARVRLVEAPAKSLSDLQHATLFAESKPDVPTAGQRPDHLARFGAKTAPTADDRLAQGVRTEAEQRGRGVTPSAAAPQAPKPEAQAEKKQQLAQADAAKAAVEEAVRQKEADILRRALASRAGDKRESESATVESLREELKKLDAKIAKAPQPAAPAPQSRSSRRKEAQTSTSEIQDLKSDTDQSLRAPAATERGRKVLQETELRRKLSAAENEKLLAPAKPAGSAPIPQPEVSAAQTPFSTFSLNVSDVSFKLAAASLEKGVMPDLSTVRSEEFINAFDYHDPEPTGGAPIAFAWERARYPFAHDRDLLRFSVKTAARGRQPGRPLNLVLLLDNSGSMERADRVLIRQECLRVLAAQLQPTDRVSVVAFARTARLWVDGLPGNQAAELPKRVGGLTPEGGTNLEDAMNLAYRTALRHFLPHGMNRVVLLTDGAANLGDVDPASLKKKVEAHRQQGIALDCFGIGWEGYNDDLLEVLSRNGDGRYGFVNTPAAAATGFAGQLAGALQVAASDVKVQVEWNPRRVTVWRQIGYAKHQLKKEQFRDNTVDAAEIAAAEAGNALYTTQVNPAGEGPLGTVRVRFKVPGTSDYREHEWPVPYEGASKPLAVASPALRLAATSAAFSEWLASSPFAGEVTPDKLLGYLSGIPEGQPADPRPKQLEWMIRQARSLGVR